MNLLEILDYSTSQIISLSVGRATIQDGNFKLIHMINLNNYQNFINDLNDYIEKQIATNHVLFPLLNHELKHIQSLLDTIKPRHKAERSLNFIGSAWKWIAGNPDHDDFELIKDKVNNVLENNNKQVIINELYNQRINNITHMANQIINSIRKESPITDQLILSVQYKLKIVKEELINIKHAIHWAKLGVINSLVLSNEEIKLAIETLDKGNSQYTTTEEILDFADVKVISNSSCLLYIIYIPITTNEIYEKLLIKPVKKQNIVNEILYENVIKSKNKIFGIINNCKTVNHFSICNRNNILDLSNSKCLPNLLKSKLSKCNKINNQHIPMIEEISEGIVLLNQFNGNISAENETHSLNGTFLLKFHNTTVVINKRIFVSREKSSTQALPPILQPTPKEDEYKEVLSVQMLKDIYINNTNQVELLKTEKTVHQYIGYSLTSVIIFILIIIITFKKTKNIKTLKIINNTADIPSVEIQVNPLNDSSQKKQTEMIASVTHVPRKRTILDTSLP